MWFGFLPLARRFVIFNDETYQGWQEGDRQQGWFSCSLRLSREGMYLCNQLGCLPDTLTKEIEL